MATIAKLGLPPVVAVFQSGPQASGWQVFQSIENASAYDSNNARWVMPKLLKYVAHVAVQGVGDVTLRASKGGEIIDYVIPDGGAAVIDPDADWIGKLYQSAMTSCVITLTRI